MASLVPLGLQHTVRAAKVPARSKVQGPEALVVIWSFHRVVPEFIQVLHLVHGRMCLFVTQLLAAHLTLFRLHLTHDAQRRELPWVA